MPSARLRPMGAGNRANIARRAAIRIRNYSKLIIEEVKKIDLVLKQDESLESGKPKKFEVGDSFDKIIMMVGQSNSEIGNNFQGRDENIKVAITDLSELCEVKKQNINDFIANPADNLQNLFLRANNFQREADELFWKDINQATYPKYRKASELDIAPEDMGVSHIIYPKLGRAATTTNSIIFIRKTSKGSVLPFEQATAVGKKLPTKGKSSNSYFTSGTIPFFASLSKKVEDWCKEQNNLVEITTTSKKDGVTPKYAYIPKLVALDSEKIRKDGQLLSGITSDALGNLLVKIDDSLEGNKTKTTTLYYLRKVKFQDVAKCNDKPVAKPNFIKDEKDECYQVFISKEHIYTSKAFDAIINKYFTEEREEDGKKIRRKTPLGEKLIYDSKLSFAGEDIDSQDLKDLKENYAKFLWEHYWYVKMKPDTGGDSPLTRFAPLEVYQSMTFYPVNVLALYTRGRISDLNKDTQRAKEGSGTGDKQYFEIVADYDVFMIAPSIERIINQMTIEQGEINADKRYFRKYCEDASLTSYKNQFIPVADKDRARHGIASVFEKVEVRRAINVHMGINAVQHGTEIANVFHISDIQEPVMMFRPGVQDISSELFFLDLKLLFKLCNPNQTAQIFPNYRPGKLKDDGSFDPNYLVDIFIPECQNIASAYILLFNLNWGTEYYFNKTLPTDCDTEAKKREYFDRQRLYFEDIIRDIEGDVLGDTRTEFNEIFNDYANAPIPVKAFSLFLFQNYRLVSITGQFGRRRPIVNERPSNLFYITKILFWGYYYEAIYNENVGFAPKVGIKPDDIAKVRHN